jgi:hypothetical protein
LSQPANLAVGSAVILLLGGFVYLLTRAFWPKRKMKQKSPKI